MGSLILIFITLGFNWIELELQFMLGLELMQFTGILPILMALLSVCNLQIAEKNLQPFVDRKRSSNRTIPASEHIRRLAELVACQCLDKETTHFSCNDDCFSPQYCGLIDVSLDLADACFQIHQIRHSERERSGCSVKGGKKKASNSDRIGRQWFKHCSTICLNLPFGSQISSRIRKLKVVRIHGRRA